jgi:hypothetical protein
MNVKSSVTLLVIRVALAGCLEVVAACSLVVSPDSLQAGCGEDAKPCLLAEGNLGCVELSNPDYGCAASSCVPCALPGASETCGVDGQCAVGTCELGRGNCNFNAADGCETDLSSDYSNCAFCGHSCDEELRGMAHTVSAHCGAMRCRTSECELGYTDCDGAAGNGCETALTPERCGRCDGCPEGTACQEELQSCEQI